MPPGHPTGSSTTTANRNPVNLRGHSTSHRQRNEDLGDQGSGDVPLDDLASHENTDEDHCIRNVSEDPHPSARICAVVSVDGCSEPCEDEMLARRRSAWTIAGAN